MDALESGAVIAGRYRVIGEIGRGGMGVVYEVEHVNTGERLALKALLGTARFNPQTVARFKREARASAQIRSEHVVRVTDADVASELGGSPFLVMELLRGSNLEEHVNRHGPIAPARLIEILSQICEALAAAHLLGIVHRDLKPENLFLVERADGTTSAKVLDFGISKFSAANAPFESGPMTSTGSMVGTPLYMAPEQIDGRNNEVAPSTDIWAMGLVALRLLTGEHFWGTPTMSELLTKIVVLPIGAPSKRWPDSALMSPELDAWFAKSCAREQRERWASVGEQLRALAAALGVEVEGVSVSTTLPASVRRVGDADREASRDTATTTPARFSTRVVAGSVLAAAAVLALLAVAFGSSGKAERHDTPDATASRGPDDAGTLLLVDIPPSETKSDAARTKFKTAMRALADMNSSRATGLLDSAVQDDPAFASAYLQRAFFGFIGAAELDERSRSAFRSATENRESLSPRDAGLLDAMAPSFSDPPDWRESATRLDRLAHRYPSDAQVFLTLGTARAKQPDDERAETAFVAARRIDPRAALSSILIAQFMGGRRDFSGAQRCLEECIRASATAIGCRVQLATLLAATGQCAPADAAARATVAVDPSAPRPAFMRARTAAANDAPAEVVAELLGQRRKLVSSEERATLERNDAIAVAARDGDFASALRVIERAEAGSAASSQELHTLALWRARLSWEVGAAKNAAEGALRFLKRAHARSLPERLLWDGTARLLAYAHAGGLLTASEYAARRDAWVADWRGRNEAPESRKTEGLALWLLAHFTPAEPTTGEAEAAFADFDTNADPVLFTTESVDTGALGDASLDTTYGALLLAVGRLDEAELRLSTAAHACLLVPEVRAVYLLGTLYAKKNQNDKACESFARVEQLWGHAKPRSITAEAARAEAKRLDCKPIPH